MYTPFATVVYSLLLVVDPRVAYAIISFATITALVFMATIPPLWTTSTRRLSPITAVILTTGLVSYGFQFEVERGQINVIVMAICLLSFWIFHNHYRYRFLSIALFSIAVQMKLYPAIFVVMFVRDWTNWKENFRRLAGIAIINAALFFVLGPKGIRVFFGTVAGRITKPDIAASNLSIRSFVNLPAKLVGKGVHSFDWTWPVKYAGVIELLLLGVVAACIGIVLLVAFRRRQTTINQHLLLACTAGALLIPAVSYDYKLPMLAGPVAMILDKYCFDTPIGSCERKWTRVLVTLIAVAYSSTLFSYVTKPILLASNTPAVLTILFCTTALAVMEHCCPRRTDERTDRFSDFSCMPGERR